VDVIIITVSSTRQRYMQICRIRQRLHIQLWGRTCISILD